MREADGGGTGALRARTIGTSLRFHPPFASMKALALLVLAVGLTAASCSTGDPVADAPASPPDRVDAAPADTVEGTGTIRYLDLEGGFYGLVADDSARYDVELPPHLQQDGLRVRFRGHVRDDVMTIRMWGTPFELHEIEAL